MAEQDPAIQSAIVAPEGSIDTAGMPSPSGSTEVAEELESKIASRAVDSGVQTEGTKDEFVWSQ